ncbi:hypothetical protein CXK92_11980 [Stutzerimonas stutzeri]|uniref:Uncharacterized protein n=1 Tax=Stutzerimonas stutzeri TaxID=316 RepID=A0A2N8S2S3_STUST|nr:hypothetical protein CXK92_11980 [Stutzerimonas stutzeri]
MLFRGSALGREPRRLVRGVGPFTERCSSVTLHLFLIVRPVCISLHAGLLLPAQQRCKPRICWLRAYVIQRISEKPATEKTSSVFSATLMSFQRKGVSS